MITLFTISKIVTATFVNYAESKQFADNLRYKIASFLEHFFKISSGNTHFCVV